MEEKEKETTITKPKRTYKQVLSERNPELNIDDDDAVTGYLDESFTQFDESEKQRKQLNDLLAKDERAAGVLTGMATGVDENGEPFLIESYLLDKYWDDLHDTASKEEVIERARKREADKVKKAADDAAKTKKHQENFARTDEELTKAVNATNVDEAIVNEMLRWVYGNQDKADGFIHKIVRNELDQQDWQRLIYAFRRDDDLRASAEKGAAEARQKRRGTPHRDLSQVPTNLGSGGMAEKGGEEFTDPTIERLNKMKRKY